MISYLEDNFFVEPYVCKDVESQYFQSIDSETFMLLLLEDTSSFSIADKAYKESIELAPFSFKNFIKIFLKYSAKNTKFSALHFQGSTELTYITVGMEPILIGGINGTHKKLRVADSASSSSFALSTYPSTNILNLVVHNSPVFADEIKNHLSSLFSKKEILSLIEEKDNIEDIINNLNFVLLNNSINKYVKYTIHEKIDGNLNSIMKFEEKYSEILESFSSNIIYNTNASLVLSELILNAFEHGILEILPEDKQKMIVEDTFDNYIKKAEKEIEKNIDISISFYDDRILKVTIDDNGKGFDFYKYMSKLTSVSDDTFRGRGLIMSLNICTALFYWGNGSKVSFYIRYKEENKPEEFILDEEAYLRSLSVLYVEDDEFIRTTLAHTLKRDVKSLYIAEDGQEGLEIFKNKKPSIVITDVEMPNLDGLDMSKEIKKISPDAHIVITTAYSSEEFLMKSIDVGIDKFLIKPISIKAIKVVLRKIAKEIFFRETTTKQLNVNFNHINKELSELKTQNTYMQSLQQSAIDKQKLVIRDDSNKIDYFDIDVFYKTVETLGGDIYGIYQVDENITLSYMIDSMGKGMSASIVPLLSVAFINTTLDKTKRENSYSFDKTIELFTNYIKDFLLEEECVNISFVEINTKDKTVKKVGFGMFPTLLFDKTTDTVKQIRAENPPFVKRATDKFKISTNKLPNNFSVFMFTDALANCEDFTFDGLINMFKNGSKTIEFADRLFEHKDNAHDFDREDLTIIKITSRE